jgi:hypothetical protein
LLWLYDRLTLVYLDDSGAVSRPRSGGVWFYWPWSACGATGVAPSVSPAATFASSVSPTTASTTVTWTRVGAGLTIGGGASERGTAWVTLDVGQIRRDLSAQWLQIPVCGRDIDLGPDGSVWVVGCNPVPGGFGIYKWNGTGCTQEPGGAVSIGVEPSGNAWVVNNFGQIFSS